MAQCKSCGAEIVWKKTESGANMPLNKDTELRWVARDSGTVVVRREVYKSHWETCPNANQHRR